MIGRRNGFVLLISLWVMALLGTVALYFAHTIRFAQHRSANVVAGHHADQAVLAAIRYSRAILQNTVGAESLPDASTAAVEAASVGESRFWILGRSPENETSGTEPSFGFVDEASKLNLNTASYDMLIALPGMTAELAAAIIDWRDRNDTPEPGGAESETYLGLDPPYQCRNAPFTSPEELRLVFGCSLDLLFGRDRNLNGVLDSREQDGTFDVLHEGALPSQVHGLLEYVTVWSRHPNANAAGNANINLNGRNAATGLSELLQETFDSALAAEVAGRTAVGRGDYGSLLEFFLASGLTVAQFAEIDDDLAVTDEDWTDGLINVNTAPAAVLRCLPGMEAEDADALVMYRREHGSTLKSVAWLREVLDAEKAAMIGPYVTTRTAQFSADIVAVGPGGRGFRRAFVVFETAGGEIRPLYRRDRQALGWCLERDMLEELP